MSLLLALPWLLRAATGVQVPSVPGDWSNLGGDLPGTNGSIQSIAVAPDGSIFAGGAFNRAGGTAARGVARWNKDHWQDYGSPDVWISDFDYVYISAMKFDARGRLFAAGYHDFAGSEVIFSHLDADLSMGSWKESFHLELESGGSQFVNDFTFLPNGHSLLAGALQFRDETVLKYRLLEVSDSGHTDWPFPGTDTIQGLTRDSSGAVLAWGTRGLRRWTQKDGWSWVGMDTVQAKKVQIGSLVVEPDGSLVVSGRLAGLGANWRLARWDGSTWSEYGRSEQDALDSTDWIWQMAATPKGLVAVGGFHRAGKVSRVVRWDGTVWNSLVDSVLAIAQPQARNRFTQTSVEAVALLPDGSLALSGEFDVVDGYAASNLVRWKEGVRSNFGNGLVGTIRGMVPDGTGGWIVGGDMISGSGHLLGGLAHLVNGVWSPWEDSINGSVYSILPLAEGGFAMAGGFTRIGTDSFAHVAKWNGHSWEKWGDGFDSVSFVLRTDSKGALFAAGNFTRSGATRLHQFARWTSTGWVDANPDSVSNRSGGGLRDFVAFSDGSLLLLYKPWDDLSDEVIACTVLPGTTTSKACKASRPGGTYDSWYVGALGLDDTDGLCMAGGFSGRIPPTSNFLYGPASAWQGIGFKYNGSANAVKVLPDHRIFVGASHALVARLDASGWRSFDGLDGTISGMAASGDTAFAIWGDLRGGGGSSAALLRNANNPITSVLPRAQARQGSFRGTGDALVANKAGSLEVFDFAGRTIRRREVVDGFRLLGLDLPRGRYFVRLGGETIPWLR